MWLGLENWVSFFFVAVVWWLEDETSVNSRASPLVICQWEGCVFVYVAVSPYPTTIKRTLSVHGMSLPLVMIDFVIDCIAEWIVVLSLCGRLLLYRLFKKNVNWLRESHWFLVSWVPLFVFPFSEWVFLAKGMSESDSNACLCCFSTFGQLVIIFTPSVPLY